MKIRYAKKSMVKNVKKAKLSVACQTCSKKLVVDLSKEKTQCSKCDTVFINKIN